MIATIYPPQCKGIPDLHLTDKKIVLGIPIGQDDFPSYYTLESIDGKEILGKKAEFDYDGGVDGVRFMLRIPGIGLVYREVGIKRQLVFGYGDSGEEAATTAIRILDNVPVRNKNKYGTVFEFALKSAINGPDEDEERFMERLAALDGRLEIDSGRLEPAKQA